jgi:hypothetical protein
MTETEYWSECNLLLTEIDDATAIFHTYEEVNRLALEDEHVLLALNADALFWKIQVYSLQTALFIVLGRIFDINPDAHSIHRVVRATQEHSEFFSKEAIAARKCASGIKPDWLDAFLAGVWEIEPEPLRSLRKELAEYSKRFHDVYRPIRHQIFAHKLLNSGEAISQLFGKTNRKELEEILNFLRALMDAINYLY